MRALLKQEYLTSTKCSYSGNLRLNSNLKFPMISKNQEVFGIDVIENLMESYFAKS